MKTVRIFRSTSTFLRYREALPVRLKIGLVPTMGYFHEGHLSLIRASKRVSDLTVVSLFVNPTQFAPHEDFSSYPRNEARDLALAAELGVDAVLIPRERDVYPGGRHICVDQPTLTPLYCGITRPHFFSGGMTVVAKLFHIVRPQYAFFGKKDYQQLFLFRQMTRELLFPVKIRAVPTSRDASGLALSSRNAYLTSSEQREAAELYAALKWARAKVRAHESASFPASQILRPLKARLAKCDFFRVDYVHCAERETLMPVTRVTRHKTVLLAAVFFHGTASSSKPKVRLIDNIEI